MKTTLLTYKKGFGNITHYEMNERNYLEQTTHVSSLPSTKGGHGKELQVASVLKNDAAYLFAAPPARTSGSPSTQT